MRAVVDHRGGLYLPAEVLRSCGIRAGTCLDVRAVGHLLSLAPEMEEIPEVPAHAGPVPQVPQKEAVEAMAPS